MPELIPGAWAAHSVTDGEGERLDAYLAKNFPELTRSRGQKLIEENFVRRNGGAAKANNRLSNGDQLEIFLPAPKPLGLRAEEIPLQILFEDDHLAVIEKPAGLVVHPAAGHEDGTLVNALLHHFTDLARGGGIGGELRPGIVHRIDRQTSGILLVTKTDIAHQHLSRQFKEHTITRRYRGLCFGALPAAGEWNDPIGRDPRERKRMAVVESGGRSARTKFRRLDKFLGPLSLFEAEL
ncbi:MAG: RluA family pseudouridine synthase, partial [Proteobacteria bacterium]